MGDDTLRVTLRLKAIDDLFRDPDLSPFDPYYCPPPAWRGWTTSWRRCNAGPAIRRPS